jgi:hypothetical protein
LVRFFQPPGIWVLVGFQFFFDDRVQMGTVFGSGLATGMALETRMPVALTIEETSCRGSIRFVNGEHASDRQ